ncbi:MAG: transglutaminase domain-containing protein [Planctomycetota bacterium]
MSRAERSDGKHWRGWWAACLAGLAVWLTGGAWADEAVEFERWYVMRLDGERVGHAVSRQNTVIGQDGSEQIVSEQDVVMSFRRGAMALTIEQSSRAVETPEGEPIEVEQRLLLGQLPQSARYTFDDAGAVMVSEQGGRRTERRVPGLPEGALMPAAAQRKIAAALAEGAESIELTTADYSSGLRAVDVTMTVAGEEDVEVLGKVVPAIAWDATASAMPGAKLREYVDAEGRPLKSTVDLGGMRLEMIAAEEAIATAAVDPPELMASTLITPSRPIDRPRELRRAVYELVWDRPMRGQVELVETAVQRVEWVDDRTARVTVDIMAPVMSKLDAADREEHLAASTMIDRDDPAVLALTRRGSPEDTTPRQLTNLLGVARNAIRQTDLSVGFATASEVARSRQGDCTEHAVLLAALSRAEGYPSRVVTGLIYADEFLGQRGVFGYHMWTQSWVDADEGSPEGRWVDLDATLPAGFSGTGFDATHIALTASPLSDADGFNDLAELSTLIGGMSIRVVETGDE